ncbi:BTB/POZ and MATH domain-containing protein 2 [Brachypodium distachyon]|uniref:MATH domain-containing protein n=1 Tax=Brachypodium distachyon TaxID=15368 RepID=I1IKB3_BRADI|nr:BTB/POZ and MATH domain-containing protein 2 [Brachypodium distachyon]KQJ87777.1 hypothetical protein BRADI_4g13500v3 [Brachypodium distachyon]|eukprot:XP_010239074.1 BTB/POZ and MATH domain-containing protein 2 [Brachypodium distachyon]
MANKSVSSLGGAPALSSSSITAKAATGSHVLKIDGFTRTRAWGLGSGKCVKSRPFTVGGHQWCLEYYPEGYDLHFGSNNNWISIRLCLAEDGDVRALYKISLLHQDGNPGITRGESSKCCTFTNRSNITLAAHGSYQFIQSEDLLKSSYLKDDAFSIRCDITVLTDIVAEDVVVATPTV